MKAHAPGSSRASWSGSARWTASRDGFFASVLARLRASLTRLGSGRRTRGRVHYWVLKASLKPGEIFEL